MQLPGSPFPDTPPFSMPYDPATRRRSEQLYNMSWYVSWFVAALVMTILGFEGEVSPLLAVWVVLAVTLVGAGIVGLIVSGAYIMKVTWKEEKQTSA